MDGISVSFSFNIPAQVIAHEQSIHFEKPISEEYLFLVSMLSAPKLGRRFLEQCMARPRNSLNLYFPGILHLKESPIRDKRHS